MEIITSLQNPKIRDAVRLKTSRGRKQQDRIIVFGQREIERAMRAGIRFESLFVCRDLLDEPRAGDTVAQLSQCLDAKGRIFEVSTKVYDKLAFGDRNDGWLAITQRPPTELENFQTDHGLLIVLEGIEKPGNVGAVFRSADASAAGGILLADPGCDIFHPNSIRSSMATVFSVPAAVGSSDQVVQWLNQNEYQILVATPEDADGLFQVDLTGRCAVVLGNEAKGISNQWISESFRRVCLPMRGTADSLNVSVTAATIMYESYRQRQMPENQSQAGRLD